jgi:endoglucanase
LIALLEQPTAPFREDSVLRFAAAQLERNGVPHTRDPFGNLIVGVRSESDYRRLLSQSCDETVRIFVAHTDHPGFHGTRWRGDELLVKWYGGSPTKHIHGSRVWLADATGYVGRGVLGKVKLADHGHAIESACVRVEFAGESRRRPRATELFGGFAFRAPVWRRGPRLYTKAADDLVGVFAILETAASLFRRRARAAEIPFIGLLTRGEEVGFIGAIAHLELGWWRDARRPLLCVSLEASRTLPGAEVGKGPIVRLGDRRTLFDPSGMHSLAALAQKQLGRSYQRRIMDGGACEGTAATAYGIRTIAMSVPLGNYHNQGFEGGPDCLMPQGPAPEFVHLDDISGLLRLCRGVMRQGFPEADPWRKTRVQLRQNLRRYAALLRG